ncbi:hypothetical protein RF55_22677 [Lasius niger]|uniref:Uncharacterized protein n=1 Tax=Lasius niger TaxID=67767 RepID=A0A0J7JWQ1_LASNI|nr:hypothetical protein RF55_22677 [Lasius niger]
MGVRADCENCGETVVDWKSITVDFVCHLRVQCTNCYGRFKILGKRSPTRWPEKKIALFGLLDGGDKSDPCVIYDPFRAKKLEAEFDQERSFVVDYSTRLERSGPSYDDPIVISFAELEEFMNS